VHYEFLKNGSQVDSRKVDFGEGAPVSPARLAEFTRLRDSYLRLLEPPISASVPSPTPPAKGVAAAGS